MMLVNLVPSLLLEISGDLQGTRRAGGAAKGDIVIIPATRERRLVNRSVAIPRAGRLGAPVQLHHRPVVAHCLVAPILQKSNKVFATTAVITTARCYLASHQRGVDRRVS